jgi:peptidyl-prolyl cis-trans isomerase D
MLQRIHDSLAKWVIVFVLGLIAFSFIFWGVDFGMTGVTTFAAKVNGENLSLADFDRELQARQNQYQQLYRTELGDDVRRQLRAAVVEEMVRDAALKQRVEEGGYRVSDERLAAFIRSAAAFQVDGQFSMDVYRGLLANQGLTPTGFEALQRGSLEVLDLQAGIADSTFLTPAEFRRYIELYNQRREIGYALFEVDAFAANVTIDDAAIATHYDGNQVSYQTLESVDLEYIELALADIASTIDVTEDALRAAYEEERERFETLEERRARHILISVGDGGEDAARTQAEGIAQRLSSGEDFATLANEISEDAGTKAQGGDLGWIGRGMLVGPFEDALFALQLGGVSAPVRSDFGYHIIRLDEVRAGELQSFEAVREELSVEYRTSRAEQQFYDLANRLGDRAFDAYNELATVAADMQLPLKTLSAFPRTGDPVTFTNSEPVVQAAFDADVLDSGRNSPLVELADDHVLVLPVVAHHTPLVKPLDEVHEQIRAELTLARAEALAEEAAAALRTELEQGGDAPMLVAERGGTWNAATWLERTDSAVPTEGLTAAFGLPKPAAGVVLREQVALANGNQAVIVLSGVMPGEPSSMTQAERDQRQRQLADQSAGAELESYVGNLRAQATVRIPEEILEPVVY